MQTYTFFFVYAKKREAAKKKYCRYAVPSAPLRSPYGRSSVVLQ